MTAAFKLVLWFVLSCGLWEDAYKRSLAANWKAWSGGSCFPLLLSELSFTAYPTAYNHKYNVSSESLHRTFPCFLPFIYLTELSFTVYQTAYNHKYNVSSESLHRTFPCFLPFIYLTELSFTVYPTAYNHKYNVSSESLHRTFPCFLRSFI